MVAARPVPAAVAGAGSESGPRPSRTARAAGGGPARPGRLRPRLLRTTLGGCGRQRLRYPQRCAPRLAHRHRPRPGGRMRGGHRNVDRSLHRAPGGVPARTADQRSRADRSCGRAGGRLAQGRSRLAGGPGTGVRERSGQPGPGRWSGQPGQTGRRRRLLASPERRLSLCVRGATGLGEERLWTRRLRRGARGDRRGALRVHRCGGSPRCSRTRRWQWAAHGAGHVYEGKPPAALGSSVAARRRHDVGRHHDVGGHR